MKKIIDGMRYDTDKAVKIGDANNLWKGCDSVTDFRFWAAALYRTPRSGRYFLSGKGGAMSLFSQSVGQNSWTGGSGLIPLTEGEAYQWAEQHLEADALEQYFPDRIQDA
jgi:hypothetical protein